MTTIEFEKANDLVCTHEFNWCRARLFHALAGAWEQQDNADGHDILTQVFEEIFDAPQYAGLIYVIKEHLLKHGWVKK